LTPNLHPRCTYRLQLSRDFPFQGAADCAEYPASLEVSHLYCSPILQSPCSRHCYDVVRWARCPGSTGRSRCSRHHKNHGASTSISGQAGFHTDPVASYSVNNKAIAHARRLIDSRQYVLDSEWGEVQPRADDENAFLEAHSWDEYAEWHLGLNDEASDQTKSRYAFVYGDFRRVHRTGLIACNYRAAEWHHKEIELAAHDLLQYLDKSSS
jgi:hypothetical protein